MNPAHPNCQLFSVHNSAFLSHHEGREISAYAEIYFRIYSDKFSYIRKYISLYAQEREARDIAPELYRRMSPEQFNSQLFFSTQQ